MIRFVGAALLVSGCGGFGFSLAYTHRKEVSMLRQLIQALQEMEWELKYRLTELPDLCRIAGDIVKSPLKDIFYTLSGKLDHHEVDDISGCMNMILIGMDLPRQVRKNMRMLGSSLGKYELDGQLQGLELIRKQCAKDLQELETGSSQRLRNYQTLTLCAGIALAILFI